MSEQRSFDRRFTEAIDAERASARLPSDLTTGFRQRAHHVRQRPRWLALIKEPPMRTDSQLAVGSPTARVAAILVATILIGVTLAAAGIAGQRLLAAEVPIIVAADGSGTVETIAEAVEMAEDGDEILIRPGTYDESVEIAKDVTIRGDGDRDEIIIENSTEMPAGVPVLAPDLPFALRLTDSTATIENLTLRGESARVEVEGGDVTFRGTHFDDIGRYFGVDPAPQRSVPGGMTFRQGGGGTLESNRFSGSTLLLQDGSSPDVLTNTFETGGIFMDGLETDPRIEGNTIRDKGTFSAISVFGGARPEIRDNIISSEGASAILIRYSGFPSSDSDPYPTIVDNTIEDSAYGIRIEGGASGAVHENRLLRNAVGLMVAGGGAGSLDLEFTRNAIRDGDTGVIVLHSGAAPRLRENVIEDNAVVGLRVTQGAAPLLEGNTICGNVVDLLLDAGADPPDGDGDEICTVSPAV